MDTDHHARFARLFLSILAVAFSALALLTHLHREHRDGQREAADLDTLALQRATMDSLLGDLAEDCYTPFFFHLDAEERDRVSYPSIRPERAVWRSRPDGAWECVANLRGTITATGAEVCVELHAKLACPRQSDQPPTRP